MNAYAVNSSSDFQTIKTWAHTTKDTNKKEEEQTILNARFVGWGSEDRAASEHNNGIQHNNNKAGK